MSEVKTETRTDGKFLFTFPKFKNKVTSLEQAIYVSSEAIELLQAETEEIRVVENQAMEAMDVIHAAETYLRCIEEEYEVDLQKVYDHVIEKNQRRGYYGRDEVIE